MDLTAAGYNLTGLGRINVILGKNGSGKSTLLKAFDESLAGEAIGAKKYITPERGGILSYQANVEDNANSSADWILNSRRANQFGQFREQSVVQFRLLEIATFRGNEQRAEVARFRPVVDKLNGLLDYVHIEQRGPSFVLKSNTTNDEIEARNISSGEAELVSLGIEILTFATETDADKTNVLLMDEPDVHLHPDLQTRLVDFLRAAAEEGEFYVVLATHSTAILGGLATYDKATVAFMESGDRSLEFEGISAIRERILPIFGAHPLSNVFNEAPILLVEGEDDVRLWQQAVRTSQGAIKLFPVSCDTVTAITDYEREVKKITNAVYEAPRAFSLRDRDGLAGELDDDLPVIRMRLACRAAENLLLSDEVLDDCGIDWSEAERRIELWLDGNPSHPRHSDMQTFPDGGYDRMGSDLKDIRMILVGMVLDSNKPWEVLVGQAIGRLRRPGAGGASPDSLLAYLGAKTVANLIPPAA